VLPHLPGEVGQNLVAVLQRDPERGVRQNLPNGTFNLDCVFAHRILHSVTRNPDDDSMKYGGEATGTPGPPLQGVFRIAVPEEGVGDSRRLFNRDEEALIRGAVAREAGPFSCPRCGGGLDIRKVPPRSDVAYVRDRILLVCNGCGRSLVVDHRDRGGNRLP